jgi:selenocysteine-specific elongation factor
MKMAARPFGAFLQHCQACGLLTETGALVRLPGWEVQFNSLQTARVNELLRQFASSPYAPPTVKECQEMLGEELYTAVVLSGPLKPVSPEVVFRREDYDEMLAAVRRRLAVEGALTAAQFRDQFNTSRRYALAFLEYLDTQGITIRTGDIRRLRK